MNNRFSHSRGSDLTMSLGSRAASSTSAPGSIRELNIELPGISTPEDQRMVNMALRHSSVGGVHNASLARLGELAAKTVTVQAVFTKMNTNSQGAIQPSGNDHNTIMNRFTNSNLAALGKSIGLERCLQVGGGTLGISDNMIAQAMNALFGAIKLSEAGEDALLKFLTDLDMIDS